jgi:phosphoglycolate phosphatase-like HAD superfamily hydrolase
MSKFVLFDIDGTLVLTGGAGLRAMNRACAEVLGIGDALNGVAVAGRTDWIILHDAMVNAGRELTDELLDQLRTRYVERLRDEIQHPGTGVKAIMPGIRELLERLSARPDVFLGLLTGNFEGGARIKLEYFDLWRYFPCGAYGDDARDRNALVPFAVNRARGWGLNDIAPHDILVIGDTPHDIACARAVNATPIGVATGSYTVEQMRQSGADLVFSDLSDTAAFLALL